jgi:PKD repeat protein
MKLRNLLILLICLVLTTLINAQPLTPEYYLKNKGEVYFRFKADNKQTIDELSRIISIDNVTAEGEVKAYANAKEFAQFLTKNIAYEILPHPGDSPQAALMSTYDQIKNLNNWNTYPTYDAYVQMMYDFATNYPNLCQITQIGSTVQNRKLLVAKITSNVNAVKPRFFYTSSIHGDETGSYVLCLRLIDYLLTNYGVDERITYLVDNIEIYINPLANPDGTYKGGNNTVNGAIRYNANYVDLNRNYPDPAAGPHPDGNAWQPETIAFMNFAEANQFTQSANFHAGAEVANYPWDTWSRLTADNTWWVMVSNEYADTAQFYSPPGYFNDFGTGITNGYQWYRITGGRQDYMNYFQQCREFTLEISNTKIYPAAQLPNLWEYNYRSMLNYMEQCLYGIRGIVTDSITSQPIKAMVFVKNHDIDSSMVFTRLPWGNYHRLIASGNWTLEFSAPGYVTKTISNVATTNYNTVLLDVPLCPVGVWADFAADKTQIEAGESVNFTDYSVGNPTQWVWNFDGGNPSSSNVQNPQNIIYQEEGVYDVALTASNSSYSNTKTKINYICVGNQYLMDNQSITTCSGKFYDQGGPNHDYSAGQHLITTFLPAETGKRIRIIFHSFAVDSSQDCTRDYLKIYNGSSTTSPLIGTWCGSVGPDSVVSTDPSGALTIEFGSNMFVQAAGWEASVMCDSGVGISSPQESEVLVRTSQIGRIEILHAKPGTLATLFSISGSKLFEKALNSSIETISTHSLPEGIYFLRLTSGSKTKVFKIFNRE